MQSKAKLISSMVLVCFLTPVWAHSGLDYIMGFETGLLHPWSGYDHLIVMFAVGLYASGLQGNSVIGLLSAFLAFMAIGVITVFSGTIVPDVEWGILLSLIVMGALLISRKQPSAYLLHPSMAGFAFCHGYAHAAEITEGAPTADYLFGLLLGTAWIIGLGYSVGRLCKQRGGHLRLLAAVVSMTASVLAFVN